jgi:hypothetical protein
MPAGQQHMRTRTTNLCLLAMLAVAAAAGAEQWFTVASPGPNLTGTRVEVDLESLQVRGADGEAVIRVTYDAFQPHSAGYQYRSFIAKAVCDCQRRTIKLSAAVYYAQGDGAGQRLGTDSTATRAEMSPALLDSIPAAARRALLRATCATTQAPPA